MRGREGGEGKLVGGQRQDEQKTSFSALPILEAFLTIVKNLSICVSTSLCGLFTGADF